MPAALRCLHRAEGRDPTAAARRGLPAPHHGRARRTGGRIRGSRVAPESCARRPARPRLAMKPSTSTTAPPRAAPVIAPAIMTTSKPPYSRSAVSGVEARRGVRPAGAFQDRRACVARPASSSPVPRFHQRASSPALVSLWATSVAEDVLPMPISPNAATSAATVGAQRIACAHRRLRTAPRSWPAPPRSCVCRPRYAVEISPGASMGSPATPASTTWNIDAVGAGEHVGGSAAAEEIVHHLPGHGLRIGRNPLLRLCRGRPRRG